MKAVDILNVDLNYQIIQQPHIVNNQNLILCLYCSNKVLKLFTENVMADDSVTDIILVLLTSESILKAVLNKDYLTSLLKVEAE